MIGFARSADTAFPTAWPTSGTASASHESAGIDSINGLDAALGPRGSGLVPGELTSTTNESGLASSVATNGCRSTIPSRNGAATPLAPGGLAAKYCSAALRSTDAGPTLPPPRLPTVAFHWWVAASDLPSLTASTTP